MRGPAALIGSWLAVVGLFFGGLTGLAVVGDVEPSRAAGVALPDTPAGRQLEWVLGALDELPSEAEIKAHFNDEFLAEVSPAQLLSVFRRLRPARPYAVASVEASSARQLVVMLEGRGTRARTIIAVDEPPPYLISTLWFGPATAQKAPAASWDEVDQRLREAAPEVGFLAAEIVDGQCRPIHAIEPNTALSLGSVFKLYVLGAAAEAVQAGRLSWSTPVKVRDDARVHTSVRTESVESGQAVALEELAGHMIEVSDNTATDLVMEAVGREAVEAVQADMGMAEPQRNVPFLTTRELSLIKFRPASLVDEYLGAGVEGRRLALEGLAGQPATVDDLRFTPSPVAVDTVEWFGSASDLCRAQMALQDKGPEVRRILGRNPGISFGSNADYVAFKGGSEPGVLAGSWYIEHDDGRRFAISVLLRNREGPIEVAALSVASDAFHLATE